MLWVMNPHSLMPIPATAPFDWLVPDWPAPGHVKAVFTTRNGGVSAGNYDSFNLGVHVGDTLERVTQNRHVLQQYLGVRPVFLNQVHGIDMVDTGATTPDGVCADGARTTQAGVACTVMVADCLPVLLCDHAGTQVAGVHAGWRGLLGAGGTGVLEAMVARMRQAASDRTSALPLLAWLGPCIGPGRFEVGPEVRAAFVADHPQAAQHFHPAPGGKWLADLGALARQRLAALGDIAVYGNDGSDAWCTVSQPSRYFSHRRDRVSGRMAACIWRTD